MLIDSTVVIDLLRNYDRASGYIRSLDQPAVISRIILMEIIAGCRTKLELKKCMRLIKSIEVEIIEVNQQISIMAGVLFEKYFHSHGLGITDALIAATALIRSVPLATHNLKHFKFIKGLDLQKPY